jgi:oxalate decarboxylase/phosphoglucose isomerase-like protein (cupin superfamily)
MHIHLSKAPLLKKARDYTEYELLNPGQTKNGNAGLKLFVLEDGGQMRVPGTNIELSYYLLNGRGSFELEKTTGASRTIIDSDTAIWVPAMKAHRITNRGEGPFRMLMAYCKSHTRDGRMDSLRLSQARVIEMVGFISRSIWAPDKLRSLGASRTIGVDLETLTPKSTLGTHEHEEEILYMLRGKGYVMANSKRHDVRPGSMVYTGPHLPHSVHNTEDDNFQYLVFEFQQ